jgi:signal transduction histidine kinase
MNDTTGSNSEKRLRFRYRFTFFQRQFVSHLLVALLILVLVGAGFRYYITRHTYNLKTYELDNAAKVITRALQREEDPSLPLQSFQTVLNEYKIAFVAMEKNGNVVVKDQRSVSQEFKSKTFLDSLKAHVKSGDFIDGKTFIIEKNTPDPLLVLPKIVRQKNPKGELYLFVMSPVQGLTDTLRKLDNAIWLTAALALVLAVAVSWFISRSMSRSVHALREATRRIAAGQYDTRSPVRRSDELGDLSNDFNSMAGQLESTSRKLEQYETNRRRFITDVTHELRTPLTSIRGIIEGLKNDLIPDPRERKRYYTIIEKETFRLIRLINELLDLEKIENGLIVLQKAEYPLKDLMEVVTESLEVLVEEKNLRLLIDCPDTLLVYGDYDRLMQILINLVKNSIQFTAYGTIRLTGFETETATVIEISDTGQGMTEEELSFIWDRFYKADPSRSKHRSETGLGLSIVKQLVEAHQGTIEAKSTPGMGTTFTLALPKRSASPAT